MEYKGYRAAIEYDESVDSFHGRVIGLRDVISFYGDTVEELRAEFETSVDDYLAFCEERGRQPDRAYSGRFNVRIAPDLHRAAKICAELTDQSLNTVVEEALESYVHQKEDPSPTRRRVRSAA